MKIDLYTKCVLTIIAFAVLWIGIQLTPTATSSRQIQDVNIVKVSDTYIGKALPVEMKK